MATQGRNPLRSGNMPSPPRRPEEAGEAAFREEFRAAGAAEAVGTAEAASAAEQEKRAEQAERAAWGPSASPTEARSQLVLGLVFGFGAAVFWAGTVLARGAGTWALLVLAALSSWLFARYFTAGVRRGALGRRRYWELLWLAGRRRTRL